MATTRPSRARATKRTTPKKEAPKPKPSLRIIGMKVLPMVLLDRGDGGDLEPFPMGEVELTPAVWDTYDTGGKFRAELAELAKTIEEAP